jgi:hypothetical protein
VEGRGDRRSGTQRLLSKWASWLPGRLYPEEVAGYIIAKLLAAATEATGAEIRKAVISVGAPHPARACHAAKPMYHSSRILLVFKLLLLGGSGDGWELREGP